MISEQLNIKHYKFLGHTDIAAPKRFSEYPSFEMEEGVPPIPTSNAKPAGCSPFYPIPHYLPELASDSTG